MTDARPMTAPTHYVVPAGCVRTPQEAVQLWDEIVDGDFRFARHSFDVQNRFLSAIGGQPVTSGVDVVAREITGPFGKRCSPITHACLTAPGETEVLLIRQSDHIADKAATVAEMSAEIARLREALEPFALIHTEGVARPDRNGYASVKTVAEYFENAALVLEGAQP